MRNKIIKKAVLVLSAMAVAAVLGAAPALAVIDGITGTTFNFTATPGYISGGDGRQIYIWGYADGAGAVQYPGPTLLLHEGDAVTITLTNNLPDLPGGLPGSNTTSMIFPGMTGVTTTVGDPGVPGLLAQEAVSGGGTVTYTFTATNPGTYYYQSATNPDLQVEMGLFGAIIVYPTGSFPAAIGTPGIPGTSTPGQAYNDTSGDSAYDREYLFLLSEMDPRVHQSVELGLPFDTSTFFATYWFINGRNGPDDMNDPYLAWLPTQPYNSVPRMHPGENVLCRLINMGRDLHPFHAHGNHTMIIAEDGKLLSTTGAAADLARMNFTMTMAPGRTADEIYTWTGAGLGWDIYGHAPSDAQQPGEYAPDHGKAFPTVIPSRHDLFFGVFYSGSPFLGAAGPLPPGEGGYNPTSAFTFMFHSHTEKELVNNNIFPGGMMTLMFVEHPDTIIP